MKKNTKKTALIATVLVVAIALMSFGFAAWTQKLTAEGTVGAKATWDIKFVEANVEGEGVAAAADDETLEDLIPEIPEEGVTTLEFGDANFTIPGGWIQYTVKVENKGSVDATIDANCFKLTENKKVNANLVFPTVTETTLKSGETCTLTFYAQSVADAFTSAENTFNSEVDFTLELVYNQATVESTPSEAHVHA